MRKTLFAGLLVIAAVLTMLISSGLDLELESTALLGISAGAVLALVPDGSAARRIAGFVLGVAVSVIAYLIRAGYTPDSTAGRALYIALAVAGCVAIAGLSLGRLSLWATLLGAGAFAGAFEATYSAAPPRVVENSWGGVTTLLLCAAIGFLAGALAEGAQQAEASEPSTPDAEIRHKHLEETK